MCGLIAMIAKTTTGFQYNDKKMFHQMLYADALRGVDSTGVFGVNKYGNLKMIKAAQPASTFQDTKTYSEFVDDVFSDFHIVVGHNRASTRGATNDDNAHPFIEGDICLVHNGTLHHHKSLADVEVDSHAICKSISERGYKDTFPLISGAYALIWYNADEKRLYISRNKERPLWLIDTKDAIYIASEPEMLQWIYKRVYNKLEKVAYFKEDHIYHWDLGQTETVFGIEDTPEKKSTPIYTPAFTPSGTTTIQSAIGLPLTKGYRVGDRVIFSHDTNTVNGDVITVRGTSMDDKTVQVQGSIVTTKLSALEIEDILDNVDYFSGTVHHHANKPGITTLYVRDIKEEPAYTTINNELVFQKDIDKADNCCAECGTIIDPDAEDGLFWARFKHGIIKKLLCSFCVSHKPYLQQKAS